MDYKRIIKNVAFIVLVPSVVVAGYYGVKFIQNRKKKKDSEKKDSEELDESKDELKDNVEEKEEEGKETKIIPITRGALNKEKEIKKTKEA